MHFECVLLVGTCFARKASWPAAHVKAALKAEHMAAPTSRLQQLQKVLANREPSTHGQPYCLPVAAVRQKRRINTLGAVAEAVVPVACDRGLRLREIKSIIACLSVARAECTLIA